MGGIRGVEFNLGVTIQPEICRWELRSSYPKLRMGDMGGIECAMN